MDKRTKIAVGVLTIVVCVVVVIWGNSRRAALLFGEEDNYAISSNLISPVKPTMERGAIQSQTQAMDSLDVAPPGGSGLVQDKRVVGGNVAESTPRLVIKTGTVTLVVKNVPESVQKVIAYANTHGGFVVSSELSKSGIAPYATITIRIPVDVYDSGIRDVKALGEVQSESSTGQDVTEQYVDLSSRLKNLQATEAQLLEIMKRAGKISDVLDVQEQLTNVRGQIESIQGQMKYLKESAAMSSLTVYLSTDPSALPIVKDDSDSWKPWAEIKNATRGLLEVGKSISYGIIWLVVYIPVWLLIIFFGWLIVRFIKRYFFKTNFPKA